MINRMGGIRTACDPIGKRHQFLPTCLGLKPGQAPFVIRAVIPHQMTTFLNRGAPPHARFTPLTQRPPLQRSKGASPLKLGFQKKKKKIPQGEEIYVPFSFLSKIFLTNVHFNSSWIANRGKLGSAWMWRKDKRWRPRELSTIQLSTLTILSTCFL